MFDNIGKKIKTLALVVTCIGVASSLILMAFIAAGADSSEGIITAFIVGAVGCLISWIGAFALYGYGELIDKTAKNERNTREILKLLRSQHGSSSSREQKVFRIATPAPEHRDTEDNTGHQSESTLGL